MAWRNSGRYHPADEILVMTCDVCGRDIGYEDGRRPQEHFRTSRHPNPGAIDDQDASVCVSSRECLRVFAAHTPGPDRVPSARGRDRSSGKPADDRLMSHGVFADGAAPCRPVPGGRCMLRAPR